MRVAIIKELRQTCFACPSQWEGTTADGRDVYIRYRWGNLTASVNGIVVYSNAPGDFLDGVIGDHEMRAYLSRVFVFPAIIPETQLVGLSITPEEKIKLKRRANGRNRADKSKKRRTATA